MLPSRPVIYFALAFAALGPLNARSAPLAKATSPDSAEVLAALAGDLPEASLDTAVAWNGQVAALVRTGAEASDITLTLVVLRQKGKHLAIVDSWPVCTLAALSADSERETHTCTLDVTSWSVTGSVPALAVIETMGSPDGRDSSEGTTLAHLYWLDDGGLRSILDATLERKEEHSDPGLLNVKETRAPVVLPTQTLGFFDIMLKGSRVTSHPLGDGPPSERAPEAPVTTSISEAYRFDGTAYAQGSRVARPELTASSQLQEKGRAADFYAPAKMQDGRLATAWAEGVPGPGIGEKVTFAWKVPTRVTKLALYGACSDRPEFFLANHRIKSIEVAFSTGQKETFALADVARVQRFTLKKPSLVTSATLTILAIYPGSKYDDTCIAEAFFE